MLFFCSDELSYNKSNSIGKNVMAGHQPKALWLQRTSSAKNDGINNQNVLSLKICQNVGWMSRSEKDLCCFYLEAIYRSGFKTPDQVQG
jgi:hypothetical protein